MILIWDNGEGYSDHTIHFADIGDDKELALKRIKWLGMHLATCHSEAFAVALVDKVHWWEGEIGSWIGLVTDFTPRSVHAPDCHWRALRDWRWTGYEGRLASAQRIMNGTTIDGDIPACLEELVQQYRAEAIKAGLDKILVDAPHAFVARGISSPMWGAVSCSCTAIP